MAHLRLFYLFIICGWLFVSLPVIAQENYSLTSNLPIIIINTNDVEIPDEPKINGTMAIIDNGPGNTNNSNDPPNDYDGRIGIEIRGNSSQMFPKKSYGFETRDEEDDDLDASLLGMPEESDWVLYAPYSDKSMLRNFITFYMGSKLDVYCTRMAFCEVIINNDYKGVYILMEKIKKNEYRVDIAKLKEEDIEGDELTGGYIIKVDKLDPDFLYGWDGWKSTPSPPYPNAMSITWQYYYPKSEDIVMEQKSYIKDFISNSEDALVSENFDDPETGYNKYINTSSFVDQMILNEVSKEVDAYRYSTFFFKQKDSDGGKLFAGPAWDFNLGYANVDYWPPGVDYKDWMYPMVEPVDWGIMFWWKRLMEDPYFEDLFYTRWQQLRENELSNSKLQAAIDSIVTYIDEAQQRNYQRWPILGEYVWPNYDWQGNNYSDEVAFFENWFFKRLSWIDNNISGSMLLPTAKLSKSNADLEINLSDDYFNQPILENKHFTLTNAPTGVEIESVAYVNATKARIKLTGIVEDNPKVSVTIGKKILNSFADLTTNEVLLDIDPSYFTEPVVVIYATRNTLHIKCDTPQLLGEQIQVFNLTGQGMGIASIEKKLLNRIPLKVKPGMYFCRYQLDGVTHIQKVIFSN